MATNTITTQTLSTSAEITKYYTNCRGVNYLPVMKEEWQRSGYLPRFYQTDFFGPLAFPVSASFKGTNKTSQWWYYHHKDNEDSVKLLRSIGINAIRVFLDIYVWGRDKTKFLNAIKDFHKICDKEKMRIQWVIWDGIEISAPAQPQNRSQTVSSLEHGLLSQWHANPHTFEVSSQAQAENFFTTCAVPYLNDIASTVSSFQSLWSFDLKNESTSSVVWLASATSLHLKNILSATEVQITFGHGAGYDPYNSGEALTNGLGKGPGGTYSPYPNYIYQMSSVIDFASIHPYTNTKYSFLKYLREAVSGANQIGIPSMANEAHFPDNLSWIRNELRYASGFNYGVMGFDGLIDYAYSDEPFRDSQGVLFADGTARSKADADTYVGLALNSNWFSRRQLNTNIVEKGISKNEGLDGGYWSGVVPEHQQYNYELYSGVNFDTWTAFKNFLYNIAPVLGLYSPSKSKNFPTFTGHPMQSGFGYSFASSGIDFEQANTMLRNFSDYFPALSSLPNADSGEVFHAKNKSLVLRSKLLAAISTYILEIVPGITWSELRGSQFDENPIPVAARYAFSAAFDPLYRYNVTPNGLGDFRSAPSIFPGIDNTAAPSWTSIACVANGTCIAQGGGTPTSYSDIDWAAYDVIYRDCVNKLVDCLDYFEDAAQVDEKFELY